MCSLNFVYIFCLFVSTQCIQISHFFIGRKEIHSKIAKLNMIKDFFNENRLERPKYSQLYSQLYQLTAKKP